MIRIPGTELDIFPLNLGANSFGWTADEAMSFAILDEFVAADGNFLDTADSYVAWVGQGGESEHIIGNWMAERGNRSKIVLSTKFEAHPKRKGLSDANVKAAWPTRSSGCRRTTSTCTTCITTTPQWPFWTRCGPPMTLYSPGKSVISACRTTRRSGCGNGS